MCLTRPLGSYIAPCKSKLSLLVFMSKVSNLTSRLKGLSNKQQQTSPDTKYTDYQLDSNTHYSPLGDLDAEKLDGMSIPDYQQTPIPTPLQTPSGSYSYSSVAGSRRNVSDENSNGVRKTVDGRGDEESDGKTKRDSIIGYYTKLTSKKEKRLSAMSFAKNFINLAVYQDNDSERTDSLVDVSGQEKVKEGPVKLETDVVETVSSKSPVVNPSHVRKITTEDYHNPNLPSSFQDFVSHFILPNCDVATSFEVLQTKKNINANVYNVGETDDDQLITNGIHKSNSVKSNSGSIRRSASFLKKNSLKFLNNEDKKKKSRPNSSETQALNISEDKFVKKLYRLETEDLIKILKYWNYDYILPGVTLVFPYLHNLELNQNQYNFFKNNLGEVEHREDLRYGASVSSGNSFAAFNGNSSDDDELSRSISPPSADKYLLCINTNDFYEDKPEEDDGEFDDALDEEQQQLKLLAFIKKKYYIKGSVTPWEILDYDTVEPAQKKDRKKSRVRFEQSDEESEEEQLEDLSLDSLSINENDHYKGHEYVRLSTVIGSPVINSKKYNGSIKPLNSLQRLNRIKNSNSDESKNLLAHNLYNKKVNLRNYNFQTLLLFKISHLVVYNNDNNLEEATKFAKIFGLLQKKIFLAEELKSNYKFHEAETFILNYDCVKLSEFNVQYYNENENVILNLTQERKYETVNPASHENMHKYLNSNPFLIPYSSSVLKSNLTNWNKNYLLHEKFENWLITSGNEIYPNLYIGNIIDYNNIISNNKLKEKRVTILKKLKDPNLDTVTGMALRSNLMGIQEKIDNIGKGMRNEKGFGAKLGDGKAQDPSILINCKEGVEFPKLELIQSIYNKVDKLLENNNLIYVEFPSSGSFILNSITNNHILSIINFLKLLEYLTTEKNYKVLIYCYDGFTHLSLLTLLIEIFNNFLNLNNSILKYYLIYERYLYWFKIDFEILNFLQPFILYYSGKNPDNSNKDIIKLLEFENIKSWYDNIFLNNYDVNCFELVRVLNVKDKKASNKALINMVRNLDTDTQISLKNKYNDWFGLDNDNNFPSKILPYLFLGGISHLNSMSVLELLGINFIITIGEKPKWLEGLDLQELNEFQGTEKLNKSDIIEINGGLKSAPFLEKIIYLPNIQDNGIDDFQPYFLHLLKIIKKFREQNVMDEDPAKCIVKHKLLINCKVGVSRSASLSIAEVMNFLRISLPRAYLYVRVRRLNLIIQPNLKIFYNLLELEEILTIKENIRIKYINEKIANYNQRKRINKKPIAHKKLRVLREVDWHTLCKEIDILNSHYIKG